MIFKKYMNICRYGSSKKRKNQISLKSKELQI